MQTVHLFLWVCIYVSSKACAESQTLGQCTSHSECSNMNEFCSRASCGGSMMCGVCRPSAECYCDSDSIDSQCPSTVHTTLAVRYLQGTFRNQSTMQAPGYECIRRLVVNGEMFIFSQFPVYTAHPASTAKLEPSEEVISECASFFKCGVFASMIGISTEVIRMNATITSEGVLILPLLTN